MGIDKGKLILALPDNYWKIRPGSSTVTVSGVHLLEDLRKLLTGYFIEATQAGDGLCLKNIR
jgi:hypothetical protein